MMVQQFAKTLAKICWFAIRRDITRKFARFRRVAIARRHPLPRSPGAFPSLPRSPAPRKSQPLVLPLPLPPLPVLLVLPLPLPEPSIGDLGAGLLQRQEGVSGRRKATARPESSRPSLATLVRCSLQSIWSMPWSIPVVPHVQRTCLDLFPSSPMSRGQESFVVVSSCRVSFFSFTDVESWCLPSSDREELGFLNCLSSSGSKAGTLVCDSLQIPVAIVSWWRGGVCSHPYRYNSFRFGERL